MPLGISSQSIDLTAVSEQEHMVGLTCSKQTCLDVKWSFDKDPAEGHTTSLGQRIWLRN